MRLLRHQSLAVTEEPDTVLRGHADLRPVINVAFDTMERRLRGLDEMSRRKRLAPAPDEARALVVPLFADAGYGFLRTADDCEFYFHRNAVLDDDFPRLVVNTELRFVPELREAGPQASTVQLVNNPAERERDATRDRADVPVGWRNTSEPS